MGMQKGVRMVAKCKRLIACLVASVLFLSSMTTYAAEVTDAAELQDEQQHTLIVQNDDNGSVTVEGDGITQIGQDIYTVQYDSKIKVTAEPKEGYVLETVMLNEAELNYTDNVAFFQMPEYDSNLYMTFIQNPQETEEPKVETSDQKIEAKALEVPSEEEVNNNVETEANSKVTKEKTDDTSSEDADGRKERIELAESLGLSEYVDEDGYLLDDIQMSAKELEKLGAVDLVKPFNTNAVSRSARILNRSSNTVTASELVPYMNTISSYLEVGGMPAFCAEHGKNRPRVGDPVSGQQTVTNEIYRKILYYGYGGPKQWSGITGFDQGRVVTSLALSYYYSGSDSLNFDIHGNYATNMGLSGFVNYIESAANAPSSFTVYLVKSNGGSTQDLMYGVYNPTGYVVLKKSSSNTEITNGNNYYSLAGAKYGVFTERNCTNQVATLTTVASGSSNTVELEAGQYYVKEISAPKGYALDTQVHSVTISSGQTATVNVADIPQSDPVGILLGKIDAETTANMPQGSASLEGAEFTVKYYSDFYSTDPAQSGISAIRTWVFKTNSNGFVRLDESSKVRGDDLYYMTNGNTTLPLGTITIQETKAPEGYLLNDEVFVRQITSQGTAEAVNTYNQPSIPEDVIRGDLQLVKFAEPEDETQDQMEPLEGIVFEITSKTTGKTVEITTDKNGYASTKQLGVSDRGNLEFDTYVVHEVNTPDGFEPVDDFEITISEEGQTLYYILEDKQIVSPIRLVKVDSTTGRTIPLANAEFKLLDEEKNPISMTTHYPNEEVHDTFKTDETGSFTLPEKLPAGVYYFREVNAPNGYILNGEDLRFEITKSYDWDEPFIVTFADAPAMGQIEIVKTDAESGDPLEGAEFIITAAEDIITPDGTVRAVEGETVDIITTEADGLVRSKALFLGKYTVTESKQPSGYVLADRSWDVELQYKDQNTEIVTESIDVENIPTKLVIEKIEAGSDKHLEGVKFAIWNKAMVDEIDPGMAYKEIITTDHNGIATIRHLTPGDYCIQEVATIPGYALNNTIYEFTVSEDGRIDGEENYTLTIENSKTEITETNVINVHTENQQAYPSDITAVDTVSMVNLQPGVEYTLKGVLMNKETGEPLSENGKDLVVEQKFTATAADMNVDVTFSFNAAAYAGETIVVFEYLYQDGVEISNHTDLNDIKQQLNIMNPSLDTTAVDLDSGTHEAIAKEQITIRDQVDYKGIIPGIYVLKGILMDQETGEPLIVDGKQITVEKEITITEESGTVFMDFLFNASDLNKKSVVVYEYLYPSDSDKPVASHEDINDKSQTVTFRLGSLTPSLPEQSGSGVMAPQTGDNTNLLNYLLAGISAICVITIARKREQGNEKNRK